MDLFKNLFKRWNSFVNQSAEIKVNQRSDRHGNVYYHLYNPMTNRSSFVSSESEIRLLLDQQRYQ